MSADGTAEHVLVTGGEGRLGRSVVQGLAEQGYAVTSVDRQLPVEDRPGVRSLTCDLTDPAATRRLLGETAPDVVVNLAAIAVPFAAPPEVLLSTNITIAENVCGAAVAEGVGKVVVASSPTVLGYGAPTGWLPPSFPLDEDTPPRPWHAYGLSKHVAEQVVAMHARAEAGEVRFASFRPCFVIAPEEWRGAPTQQGHTVHERLDDPALSAPALFNYVDARDVTDFLAVLIQKIEQIPNGECFFVSAPDALAREPLAELLPRFVPGSEELAAGLTGTRPAFSSAKAERLLGWRPRRTWREELVRPGQDGSAGAEVTA